MKIKVIMTDKAMDRETMDQREKDAVSRRVKGRVHIRGLYKERAGRAGLQHG